MAAYRRLAALCVGILFLIFDSPIGATSRLSLETYVQAMKQHHQGFQSASLLREATRLRISEASLVYMPSWVSSIQGVSDSKQSFQTSFTGSNTRTLDMSTGYRFLTEYGLQGTIGYRLVNSEYSNPNPLVLSNAKYSDGSLTLDLTLPLWRNALGAETKAASESTLSQYKATAYSADFLMKQLVQQAQLTYWKMVLANEAIDVTQKAFERAQSLLSWATRRSKLGLADTTDALQARATLEQRRLDRDMASQDAESAARNFNSLIGSNSSEVDFELQTLDSVDLLTSAKSDRMELREDVQSAQEKLKALKASLKVSDEQTKPSLDLISSIALNSRDYAMLSSLSNIARTDSPTYLAAIKLNVPLDTAVVSSIRSGLEKQAQSAQLDFERKKFDSDREWDELMAKLRYAYERYRASDKIEALQREKWQHELDRHRKGRTTMAQVLLFEQDYDTAQFNRIRAKADILTLKAQLKLFEEQ